MQSRSPLCAVVPRQTAKPPQHGRPFGPFPGLQVSFLTRDGGLARPTLGRL